MALTREQRRESDPTWQKLEEGLRRALAQKADNPAVCLRISGKDEETAKAIWSLLTNDEKLITVVDWTTAHFLTKHPQWVALADPKSQEKIIV